MKLTMGTSRLNARVCRPRTLCRAAPRDHSDIDDHDSRKRKVLELNKLMYMDRIPLTCVEINNMLELVGGKNTRHFMYIDVGETLELSLVIDRHVENVKVPEICTHDDVTIEFVNELCASEKVREQLTSSLLLWGKSLVFPIRIPLSVFFHSENHGFV